MPSALCGTVPYEVVILVIGGWEDFSAFVAVVNPSKTSPYLRRAFLRRAVSMAKNACAHDKQPLPAGYAIRLKPARLCCYQVKQRLQKFGAMEFCDVHFFSSAC
jgi:hypothetical protein